MFERLTTPEEMDRLLPVYLLHWLTLTLLFSSTLVAVSLAKYLGDSERGYDASNPYRQEEEGGVVVSRVSRHRERRSEPPQNPQEPQPKGSEDGDDHTWDEYVENVYKIAFGAHKHNDSEENVTHVTENWLEGFEFETEATATTAADLDELDATDSAIGNVSDSEDTVVIPVKRGRKSQYDFVFDPTNRNEECKCGTNEIVTGRVVGGMDAELHEFPWQVGLFTWNRGLFCGGSLINNRYVLTAAHCVVNKTEDVIKAILADHDLSTNMESKSKSIKVIQTLLHPSYTRSIYTHDIAILKLASDVKFSKSIRPPCFPKPGSDYSSTITIVSGWGATQEGQPSHSILQKAPLPVIPWTKCRDAYGDIVGDTVMCVGGLTGRDACQGDSGGPLIKTDSIRHFIIGVVSWGSGCGNADLPGVYTRVDKFYDWIYETTKEGTYCK